MAIDEQEAASQRTQRQKLGRLLVGVPVLAVALATIWALTLLALRLLF